MRHKYIEEQDLFFVYKDEISFFECFIFTKNTKHLNSKIKYYIPNKNIKISDLEEHDLFVIKTMSDKVILLKNDINDCEFSDWIMFFLLMKTMYVLCGRITNVKNITHLEINNSNIFKFHYDFTRGYYFNEHNEIIINDVDIERELKINEQYFTRFNEILKLYNFYKNYD